MSDIFGVDILQALKNLVDVVFNHSLFERFLVFDMLLQQVFKVVVHILKDNVLDKLITVSPGVVEVLI